MILRKGRVLAQGSANDLRQAAGQSSLEHAFVHLVEDRDATQTARDLADAMATA
jgi:ABC-type Na+ transport system ATPase subunit NatA